MNHSGRAVAAVAGFYKVPAERILIAHDEIDLPPGTVRLKRGGGHGGHNGLRDVVPQLAGAGFSRIRIGVGHPGIGTASWAMSSTARRQGSGARSTMRSTGWSTRSPASCWAISMAR